MNISMLVEIECPKNADSEMALQMARGFHVQGFTLDEKYEPVFMHSDDSAECKTTVIVRGWSDTEIVIEMLQGRDEVVKVWKDTIIAPMTPSD